MSTYISPSFQPSQYVSGIPLDLVIQVGSMKQQQYNQNLQNTQSQIDLLGQQDIIRPEDKDIINQRLSETVDKLNQFSSQDLSDPRVAGQLNSVTGQAFNDTDISTRIANNKRARQFLNTIEDTKRNHPEQYNSANEMVAMQGFNKWYNDPTQTQFDANYTPYFDVNKTAKDLLEPIMKNPDIRQQIETYTDSNGIVHKRGEQEIKEITRDKVMQALSGLPEAAKRQLLIEYQANNIGGGFTPQGALQGLNTQASTLNAQIDNINSKLNDPNITPALKSQYQQMLDNSNAALTKVTNTANQIATTGDASLYYTPQSYLSDRLGSIADTYAYTQVGKTEYDDIFKMDYKFEQDKQMKALDAQYDQQLENLKAANKGLGAVGNIDLMDDDVDQITNIKYNGKGTLTTDQSLALLNGVGKTNDDGSAQLNLAGRKLYFDIAPTLQQAGVNPKDELQAGAYQDVQKAYTKWREGIKGVEGSGINGKVKYNPGTGEVLDTFDKFLKTEEGKKLFESSKNLGLDLTNSANAANVQRYLNSPQAALTQIFGKGLDNLPGSANFVPFRQDNVVTDNNGDMYTKGSLRMNRGDWITRLNSVTNDDGEDLWDKLIDGGFIKYTSGKAGDDASIAEMVVTTKLDRDLNSYYDQRVRERFTGDKAGAEQIPLYKQNFNNQMSTINQLNRLDTRDPVALGGRANVNIINLGNSGTVSGTDKTFWSNTITALQQKASDPNTPTKQKALALLKLDEISKMSSLPTTTGANTSGGTGDISTRFNNPGNMIYKPWMNQYGAIPSGQKQTDGDGIFANFPTVESGYNAYKQQLFGDVDGTFNSKYYKSNTPVDEALKKWSNGGYGVDIYPEIKGKTLGQLTQAERNELVKRQIQRESPQMYTKLVSQGIFS